MKAKIDIEELRCIFEKNPKAKLAELAKVFNCTPSSVSQALTRHHLIPPKDLTKINTPAELVEHSFLMSSGETAKVYLPLNLLQYDAMRLCNFIAAHVVHGSMCYYDLRSEQSR